MKINRLFGGFVIFILVVMGCSKGYESRVASSDGVPIHYYVQGKGDPALVFVHGFASDHRGWAFQAVHFSKKYRVVVVELAGFGASGNSREDSTMLMSYMKSALSKIRSL